MSVLCPVSSREETGRSSLRRAEPLRFLSLGSGRRGNATLVEGAVANEENLELIKKIRERTKLLVSFGDCAVTGNVTAMRNPLRVAAPVIERSYLDETDLNPRRPSEPGIVPPLLDQVLPVHAVVPVDLFLPGCPPSADLIYFVLSELVDGRTPDLKDRLSYG